MNRPIKFRAWNGKSMIEPTWGDWIAFDGTVYTQAYRTYNTPNIEIEQEANYIIMQFTGLTDKNGKEIYEGDILASDCVDDGYNILGPVCWNNELAGWEHGIDLDEDDSTCSRQHVYIIGNIYQNPELLIPQN